MDAGVEILKPLTAEVKSAKKHGFYMDRNNAFLLRWAHPSAISYLNYSRKSFIGLHDTDAGYLAVDYNKDFLEKVILHGMNVLSIENVFVLKKFHINYIEEINQYSLC